MAFDFTAPTETADEIIDTIECIVIYLDDARENAGKGGPFAHVFDAASIEFAHKQLAFECTKLENL